MQQVPADKVIALLTQQLGDLYRENAILQVQVTMYEADAAQAAQASLEAAAKAPRDTPAGAHADAPATSMMSAISGLPPIPDTTGAPNLSV